MVVFIPGVVSMVDSIAGVVSVKSVDMIEDDFIEMDSSQLHNDSFCIFVTDKRDPSSIKLCHDFYY